MLNPTLVTQTEQLFLDGSECYIEADFNDINCLPYTPITVRYRVDDLTNGVSNVPWTAVGSGTSITLTLNTTVNTMSPMSRLRERRQVLVEVGIPGGTLMYQDLTYVLIRKVGTP